MQGIVFDTRFFCGVLGFEPIIIPITPIAPKFPIFSKLSNLSNTSYPPRNCFYPDKDSEILRKLLSFK